MNQNFEYKGYIGSIEADIEEGFLFGRLLYIRDVISYQADDVAGLKTAFFEAVDDYLATCAELGEQPETPCKGSFNVRIGPEVHQRIAISAGRLGISLNEWIRLACISKLDGESIPAVNARTTITNVEVELGESFYGSPEGGLEWQQQKTSLVIRH